MTELKIKHKDASDNVFIFMDEKEWEDRKEFLEATGFEVIAVESKE